MVEQIFLPPQQRLDKYTQTNMNQNDLDVSLRLDVALLSETSVVVISN
jgi:hypothetical protein